MSIEKGLYAAPQGLDQAMMEEPDLEIEIEDPESVTIGMGNLELEIDPQEMGDDDFEENLAEDMPESLLATIASDLLADFEDDVASR